MATTQTHQLRIGVVIAAFLFGLFWLFHLLSSILTPFIAGALLAYLCDPLVNLLMRLHLSRLSAVGLVFLFLLLFLILLIVFLIPMIESQSVALISTIPSQIEKLQTQGLPWLLSHLGIQTNGTVAVKKLITDNLSKVGNLSTWTLQTIVLSGKRFIDALINLVLTPVVTFYLLRDWDTMLAKIQSATPRSIEPVVVKLAMECNTVLGAFFRGQLLVMLALCVMYSAVLTLIGLQTGIVIGLIVGILSLVPYLGSIIGLVIALIAAFVQFGTWASILLILAIFSVGHVVENAFLAPKLIGDRVGLHPVAVIFALLVGAKLFGFFGILLALPVASVMMVLLRNFNQYYQKTSFYKRESQ